ncbi:MAG: hypothetical protein H7338_17565 [Candidatus Sericytochromatia bacterium]|nr:hypothetical protein [Candidatus Sericytochromatia bacterium]
MKTRLQTSEPTAGSILYRIRVAAALHPSQQPKRPKAASSAHKKDHYTPHATQRPAQTSVGPDLKFIGRVVRADIRAPQTFGAVAGVIRPYASQTVFTRQTVTVPPQKAGSISFVGTVGSWIYAKASGMASSVFYTVKNSLPFAPGHNDPFLAGRQGRSVAIARTELAAGVGETGGANRGRRIDQYARESRMSTGEKWCGLFVGFAYSRAGFKKPEAMASLYKARLFFLYQSLDGADGSIREHRAQGQLRQFFMLSESPSRAYIRSQPSQFPHFNVDANTFPWRNLPARTGDTVLFERDARSGSNPTHVGIVESYDRATGRLVTIEGNVSNAVVRKTYDLKDAAVRRQITGIGRPAPGDFT